MPLRRALIIGCMLARASLVGSSLNTGKPLVQTRLRHIAITDMYGAPLLYINVQNVEKQKKLLTMFMESGYAPLPIGEDNIGLRRIA